MVAVDLVTKDHAYIADGSRFHVPEGHDEARDLRSKAPNAHGYVIEHCACPNYVAP